MNKKIGYLCLAGALLLVGCKGEEVQLAGNEPEFNAVLEEPKTYTMRNTADDRAESKDSYTLDFNGDGKEETLLLVRNSAASAYGNNPVEITMSIESVSVVHQDEFNDGIHWFVADFDVDDRFWDICIWSTGTGAFDYHLAIYRYNGEVIELYDTIDMAEENFDYDGSGGFSISQMDFDFNNMQDEMKPVWYDYRTRRIEL